MLPSAWGIPGEMPPRLPLTPPLPEGWDALPPSPLHPHPRGASLRAPSPLQGCCTWGQRRGPAGGVVAKQPVSPRRVSMAMAMLPRRAGSQADAEFHKAAPLPQSSAQACRHGAASGAGAPAAKSGAGAGCSVGRQRVGARGYVRGPWQPVRPLGAGLKKASLKAWSFTECYRCLWTWSRGKRRIRQQKDKPTGQSRARILQSTDPAGSPCLLTPAHLSFIIPGVPLLTTGAGLCQETFLG